MLSRRHTMGLLLLCGLSLGAAGRPVLDASLIDESGRSVHFNDLVKGHAVAINFIFTRCTSICLPMSGTFVTAEKLEGSTGVRFISISIDPEVDTPGRLAAWKERFGGGSSWTLLTGGKAEIDRLAKGLGAFSPDRSLHSPTVIVYDEPSGRMVRLNGLGGAKLIVRALHDVGRNPEDVKP